MVASLVGNQNLTQKQHETDQNYTVIDTKSLLTLEKTQKSSKSNQNATLKRLNSKAKKRTPSNTESLRRVKKPKLQNETIQIDSEEEISESLHLFNNSVETPLRPS